MNKTSAHSSIIKFFLFFIIIAILLFLGKSVHVDLKAYQQFIQQFSPVLAGIIFIILYIFLTTFIWFGPKDILRIVAALLFGPGLSTLFVWLGELGNCIIFFHISRYLGRDFIAQKFKISQDDLEKTKKTKSALGLIALRLNPLVPFRFLDIGVGLSEVSFKKYFFIALVFSPFRIFWIQYIIAGVGEGYFQNPMIAFDYFQRNPAVTLGSFFYFGVIFILSFIAIMVRRKKS
ncbi:MAG TPA: VTT domain-containing protein [Candidatus Omnitrophota bacterium]|nr:VTT domain-containing protein [Candidatus Omnitrophota bacterium]